MLLKMCHARLCVRNILKTFFKFFAKLPDDLFLCRYRYYCYKALQKPTSNFFRDFKLDLTTSVLIINKIWKLAKFKNILNFWKYFYLLRRYFNVGTKWML